MGARLKDSDTFLCEIYPINSILSPVQGARTSHLVASIKSDNKSTKLKTTTAAKWHFFRHSHARQKQDNNAAWNCVEYGIHTVC